MMKDRYGNRLPAVNSIIVFDPDLNYDSERFENTYCLKLKEFNRERFKAAYEIDLGAGAGWPVLAYQVAESLIPFSAIAAALFCGEKIEKSWLAWKRIADSLLSCIPAYGFVDANGAALLALEKVFAQTGCSEVHLIAYTWVDQEPELLDEPRKANAVFEIIAKLDGISPRDQQFGVGLHSPPTFLFKFDANGEIILAKVRRKCVDLIKL